MKSTAATDGSRRVARSRSAARLIQAGAAAAIVAVWTAAGAAVASIADATYPQAPLVVVVALAATAAIVSAGWLLSRRLLDSQALSEARQIVGAERERRRQRAESTESDGGEVEALRESAERFRDIAQVGSGWIWETGADHRFTAFMGAMAEHLHSQGRLGNWLGRMPWEAAGGDPDNDERWRGLKEDMDARRPFRQFRYSMDSRAGAWRHISVSGKPVFDAAGQFLGYRGTAADETEIVDARDRAERAEALLRDAVDSMAEGFMIFDRDDRLILCNEAYRRFYPESSEFLVLGNTFEDILRAGIRRGRYPMADHREEEWLAERMRHHRDVPGPIEVQIRGDRWVLISERRMRNGGTTSLRIDVSALKSAQAALRASEAKLRRSQEHLAAAQRIAGIGSAETDFRSDTTVWSDETFRIFGLKATEAGPSRAEFLALVHEDDRERVLATLRTAQRGDTPVPIEYRIRRPNGELRTIYCEAVLMRDEQGTATGILGTIRDVTELRAMEKRRNELEAQLIHSQKIESLGTLAGGIAHDLNNTMVPVVALSKMMADRFPPGSRERTTMELIYEAGTRSRDLVKQILAFSKKQQVKKEKLDLDSFVRATLQMIRATVPATIRIDYQSEAGLPPVLGDPSQLHQVLINLTTNAVHAIGTSTGTVTISLGRAAEGEVPRVVGDGPRRLNRLSVRDTGCGMDKTTIQRMFEPFFTTKGVGEGTGLGLAVVHGIIANHGGRIQVSSELGAGTRFDIYLPPDEEAVAI